MRPVVIWSSRGSFRPGDVFAIDIIPRRECAALLGPISTLDNVSKCELSVVAAFESGT